MTKKILSYAQLKGAKTYGLAAVVLWFVLRDLSHSLESKQVEFWRDALDIKRHHGGFCDNAISSKWSRIHQDGKLKPDVTDARERLGKRYRRSRDVPLFC